MRSLTHISFYPPPSMPPVQPATAWYCPRILTTAWAMWPGGAVMEYRPVPFLPNGELGLKMATDVSMSLVEGASISSAFEKEYGEGIVRLPAVQDGSGSWSWFLTADNGESAAVEYSSVSTTACNDSTPELQLCVEPNNENGTFTHGPSGLPVVALTFHSVIPTTSWRSHRRILLRLHLASLMRCRPSRPLPATRLLAALSALT